jgi:3-isopropylmalate/(R)-2-methylmalate dehydratase small subunit
LPIVLPEETVAILLKHLQHHLGMKLTIDLPAQTVSGEGFVANFEIDAYRKHRMLGGLDDIGETLQNEGDITKFEANRPVWKPSLSAANSL